MENNELITAQIMIKDYKDMSMEINNIIELLDLFKKTVTLELHCLNSEDRDMRLVGYDAQYIQQLIESKLLKLNKEEE